jgi:hypothetical protein
MDASARQLLAEVERVQPLLEANQESVLDLASASGSAIDPGKCLSNFRLVLDEVVAFYEDPDKAAYFPHAADVEVTAALSAVKSRLAQFQATPNAQQAVNALTVADQFYAVALRYGLITFGLDANKIKEIVSEFASKRRSVRRTAEKLEEEARGVLAGAEAAAAKAKEGFENGTSELRSQLEQAVSRVQAITEQLDAEQEKSDEARKLLDERIASLREEEQSVEALASKASEALTASAESAAEAKATAAAIQELRAKAKDEMEKIVEFYADVEKHQDAMIDTQKEATATFSDLKGKYGELLQGLEERSRRVVELNVELQQEIKRHLQAAVGASLFAAFDSRRRWLNWGKWIWAGAMVAGVVAGGWLSFWLTKSISGATVEPAFWVKLSAVIPVSFAIVFSAKQYANERRTEEEYAFKSTISVSLVPYKDLLAQMRADGHGEHAAFVEKLLLEIFDNPVKRVYADVGSRVADDESKMRFRDIKQLIGLAKDFDPERAKKLLELFVESSARK